MIRLNTKVLASICFILALGTTTYAGDFSPKDSVAANTDTRKWYWGNALDGAIFSTATMQRPGLPDRLGTLRFSLFFNFGFTYNYNFNNHVGLYTGVDIKNVGFIEKRGDSTIKRRTYNIGVPIGIKIGDMNSRNYGFFGAGLDMPFNYKEKGFVNRSDKQKFNEWFSARTPTFMPYVFAGMAVKGGTIKVQYYLTNFLSTDYVKGGVKPYDGYNVHLLLVSFGMAINHPKHSVSKPHNKSVNIAMNN